MMAVVQERTATPSAATRLVSKEAMALAVAFAGEAVVVVLAFSAQVPLAATLSLHAAVAAIVAVILFRARGADEDTTVAALMCMVIAIAGPAGAAASLAALAFVDRAGAGPDVLDAWYTRLANASNADASTELTDRVVAGRVLRTDAPPPENFEDIIAHGSLADRQAALGLMARHFHTDYAPALQAALRSQEPVVRVQAAAVVARVRTDLKSRLKGLLAVRNGGSAQRAVSAAAELIDLASCSFVDRADAERCWAAASQTLQTSLGTSQDVLAAAAKANSQTAPLIERYLVTSGRFNEFRLSRRVHNLVLGRRYRVRMLRPRLAA
jgi:hypothetical protein